MPSWQRLPRAQNPLCAQEQGAKRGLLGKGGTDSLLGFLPQQAAASTQYMQLGRCTARISAEKHIGAWRSHKALRLLGPACRGCGRAWHFSAKNRMTGNAVEY